MRSAQAAEPGHRAGAHVLGTSPYDQTGEGRQRGVPANGRPTDRLRVKRAETVTIRSAAARQVEDDDRDEQREHRQCRGRTPPGRARRNQCNGAGQLAERQKTRQRRGENRRDAEFAQRLPRTCTIEKLGDPGETKGRS